ncbi:MAG TPA: hypothetical protein VG939_09125 [Caulobacteraceae bacterium]|nr:hypothetical protein [Caulobacteraceae bacterium]
MRDQVDLKGASGQVLRFMMIRDGRPLSPMGGNYAYLTPDGDGYRVLCLGETQNLLKHARDRWDEAVQMHGPAHLYVRLNISERIRQQEHADLLAGIHPAMNATEPTKRTV